MAEKTVFTRVKVTGDMDVPDMFATNMSVNSLNISSMKKDMLEVNSPAAEEAAGPAPTKAEYDAVVTLVNEIKTKYNTILSYLAK